MQRCSLILLIALYASIARAQPAAPVADDYEQLIQQGEAAVVGADWNACLDRFTRAQKLRPSAVTYLAIGRCELEKKDYVSALHNLQEGMRFTLPELQRERAQDIYQLARRHLGRFRVALSPPQSVVQIDGAAPAIDPEGAFWLSVGSHKLRMAADGYQPLESDVVVNSNDDKTLTYRLEPLPKPSAILKPAPAVDQPTHPTVVQWILLGGSGAIVITGGVLLGLAVSDKSTVENANNKALSEIQAAHDRVPVFSGIGAVMLGVGLAGAGATLGWILLGGEESRPVTTLRVGPGGMQIQGVF